MLRLCALNSVCFKKAALRQRGTWEKFGRQEGFAGFSCTRAKDEQRLTPRGLCEDAGKKPTRSKTATFSIKCHSSLLEEINARILAQDSIFKKK
mmetsp:Transcript_87864/g.175764  ORF Transcript_87864/g.175764 Transcript_87864/m.175764 type:complete len:94 (+) Transcript_87864:71-352(+)